MMEDIFDVFEEILMNDGEDLAVFVERPLQQRIFRERPDHFQIWDNTEFLNRFRLSRETVQYLLHQIEGVITHHTKW